MGELYLVATPIGNLKDITLRAIEILGEVDLIAAEDTRQTLKLLNHLGIKKPLISYHHHNRREAGEKLIKRLQEGNKIALVSDAGTPGISDPGEDIVKLCVEEGIEVYACPGPVAGIYALTVSGLSTDKFVFEGFIERDGKGRREDLERLKAETKTMILYEAPHRLQKTLSDIYEYVGDRRIAICRELTKRHEQILRLTVGEAIKYYEENNPKGEFVLILQGLTQEDIDKEREERYENLSIVDHILKYIEEGNSKKDAIKLVSKERKLPKSEVYKESLKIEN
ncbi:16S rRNA (cytidine(1402)-2'-O)-methyltransferase [Clostridium cylindrosporum]|uniref:Ribosomal RNA small subunit methyltransferase I n=1 Tax=Clostridium cylindrosporum DSM 605 TaxID=1121307 RepID=A0A0J8DAR5_CLOCY|nr:16S rRNA (cytidine(1402)-2'-O)-methyltransferase [Clostridium cylindrosporum]KMT22942.1 ribosomal RNA small subunit methyltransferase I [Clostridium cylindrosporum DSM 605]